MSAKAYSGTTESVIQDEVFTATSSQSLHRRASLLKVRQSSVHEPVVEEGAAGSSDHKQSHTGGSPTLSRPTSASQKASPVVQATLVSVSRRSSTVSLSTEGSNGGGGVSKWNRTRSTADQDSPPTLVLFVHWNGGHVPVRLVWSRDSLTPWLGQEIRQRLRDTWPITGPVSERRNQGGSSDNEWTVSLITRDDQFGVQYRAPLNDNQAVLSGSVLHVELVAPAPPQSSRVNWGDRVKDKLTAMQSHLEGYLVQPNHVEQKSTQPARSWCDEIAVAERKTMAVRQGLLVMRKSWQTHQESFEKWFTEQQTEWNAVKTDFKQFGTNMSRNGFESNRRNMEVETMTLRNQRMDMSHRTATLCDLVDKLKQDLIERSAVPPKSLLAFTMEDAKELARDIRKCDHAANSCKENWKKVWEHELALIVQEQNIMKSLQHDIKEDLNTIDEQMIVMDQVQRLAELKSAQPHDSRPPSQLSSPPRDPHHSGISTVMQELLAVEASSEKRLEALERQFRVRERELTWRKRSQNAFERELKQFVQSNTLKNTGGIDGVEQARRIRMSHMLRSLKSPEGISKLEVAPNDSFNAIKENLET